MAGIPTVYSGTKFRSRVEARWAAWFDRMFIRWVYEPYDFDGWIPDFSLPGKRELLIEVKSELTVEALGRHVAKIERADPQRDVLIVGAHPFLEGAGEGAWDPRFTPIGGVLIQHDFYDEEGHVYMAGDGIWTQCCAGPRVAHGSQSYARRPCGCYDGGHIPDLDARLRSAMSLAWELSGNETRWSPAR